MAAIVADLQSKLRRGRESSRELAELVSSVRDSSPQLGFFDLAGVIHDDNHEVEVPDFRGHADFADVMFWNIENFNDDVASNRIERVAEVLDGFSMDVMGLVEIEGGAMRKLVEALRRRGQDMDFVLKNVPFRQDLAVLFDRDTTKVELLEEINERHAAALSVRTRQNKKAFPREPLFAKCTIEADNTNKVVFIIVVLHLKAFGDAQSRARRRLAAKKLREIVDDIRTTENLPVVIGGDFNDVLNTDVFRALQSAPDLVALTADDASDGAISFVGDRHQSLIDHIVISSDLQTSPISDDDAAIVRLDRSMADFVDDISDHVPLAMRIVTHDGTRDGDDRDDGVPDDDGTRIPVPSGSHTVVVDFE